MSAKTQVRRQVAEMLASSQRHKQTHSVFVGKVRIPAWKDGDVIRAIYDNSVVAKKTKDGWNKEVRAVKPHKPGRYDEVTAYPQAVAANFNKSLWDGIKKGEFF